MNIEDFEITGAELVENENEIDANWFRGKKYCGISAGASTPEWLVERIIKKIKDVT